MLLRQTGATTNPYLYRGEQFDADLSVYYLRARSYQAATGRFLTTDPVEGFPTEAMSLHRYLYGNDNPVSMIDPSGRMTLNEQLVVETIIGNLGMIAVGSYLERYCGFYSTLGEWLLPDAFILGGNINFATSVLSLLGLPMMPEASGNASFGFEMLCSVTSGQLAFFKTKASGFDLGLGLPSYQVGLDIYKGSVWNLWNADNYTGPFESFNMSTPQIGRPDLSRPDLSLSIFWDAINGAYNGSWGISRTIFSKAFFTSAPCNALKASFGGSYVDYIMLGGKPINLSSEADAVLTILTAIFITDSVIMAQTVPTAQANIPAYVSRLALQTTLWVQTGMAKFFWNLQSSDYNLSKRQLEKNRPEDFHSGPTLFSTIGSDN